jgi:hypothetical protein
VPGEWLKAYSSWRMGQDGAPFGGALVGLADGLRVSSYRYRTSTDANGHYQFDFPLAPPAPTAIFATVSARDVVGHVGVLTWPGGGYTSLQDMRLQRHRGISAGQSMVIPIDRDSTVCVWEWESSPDTLCAHFLASILFPLPTLGNSR